MPRVARARRGAKPKLEDVLKSIDVNGILKNSEPPPERTSEDGDEDGESETEQPTTKRTRGRAKKSRAPRKRRGRAHSGVALPSFLEDDEDDMNMDMSNVEDTGVIKDANTGARRLTKGALRFDELPIGEDIPRILRATYKRDDINTVPTIENYVCTFWLGRLLSLRMLVKCLYRFGAESNSRRFASVLLKFMKSKKCPSAVALIFQTGEVVCTGTKSEHDARVAARLFAKLIRTAGKHNSSRVTNLSVCNIVGTLRMGVKLDLRALSYHLEAAAYEPENFPGLIHKNTELHTHFIVYDSGKIVITGARTVEHIANGARYIAKQCCYAIKGSVSARRLHETNE